MRIFKYELNQHVPNAVQMSENSKIVGVGLQNDVLVIWATCEPFPTMIIRRFVIVYTGEEFNHLGTTHLGTVQKSDGIVLHVLEVPK